MGMFNRNKLSNDNISWSEEDRMVHFTNQLTEAKRRAIAVDYLTNLTKKDLDLFTESIQLIWQGYNILNRIKTVAEKREEREAKEEDLFNVDTDDELGAGFLDSEK